MNYIGALTAADMALLKAAGRGRTLDEALGLSRFAAHAACAINSGSDFARKSVAKVLESDQTIQLAKLGPNRMPTALHVVEELLATAASPPPTT